MSRRARATETAARDMSFEALLTFLRKHRGFDFDGYKRTSLARRIDKRMADVGVRGYASYVDFLEVHPEEFLHLFNTASSSTSPRSSAIPAPGSASATRSSLESCDSGVRSPSEYGAPVALG